MKDRLFIIFILGALFVFALASQGPLKKRFGHSNGIDFSVTEDDHTLRMEFYYPNKKTSVVEEFIKERLKTSPNTTDQVASNSLNVPDSTLSYSMRTRNGYLELAIQKEHNSKASEAKFRLILKELEHNIDRLVSR